MPVRNGLMLGLTASTALSTRGGFPVPALSLNFLSGTLDSRITFTRALNTATRVNSSGFIETVNANIPRFDFGPITGDCRGLLIEESRANLLIASANLTDAAWQNVTATIATSAVLSPDGVNFAQTITSTANGSRVQQFVTATFTSQTYSFFMKQGNTATGRVRLFNNTTAANVCEGILTFATEQFTIDGGAGTATVTKLKNAWYRVALAATTGITVGDSLRCFIYPGNSTSAAGDFMYAWGAQLEAGAFATSYIPTTTTSLTRNADAASMTGTNFSSWYNPIEGTLVASGSFLAVGNNTAPYQNALVGLSDETSANAIQFGKSVAGLTTDRPATFSSNGNFSQSIAGVTITASSIVTMALGLKANSVFFAANGVAGVEDTSCSVPVADQLGIGNFGAAGLNALLNGHIRTFTYFNTRLPNDRALALSR